MPNFTCMCSLCRLLVAKNHNFGHILTFLGLLYRPYLTDEGKMWCAIADPRYTFKCKISSWSVYSVALCWRKTPFLPFFGLRHLVLSPVRNSLTKLNTGAQLQAFPYPTASNSFLYSSTFIAKSGAHLWRSKAWRINRQTKNSTLLATPAAAEIRAPPNLACW